MSTKRSFVNRIAVATGYPKVHIAEIINRFLGELTAALAKEGRVELRDFGVLFTVELAARTGRNPATGEPVAIARSRHVRFRAGKHMREQLNR